MIAAIINPYLPSERPRSSVQMFHMKDSQPFKLVFESLVQRVLPKSLSRDLQELATKFSRNEH